MVGEVLESVGDEDRAIKEVYEGDKSHRYFQIWGEIVS
jgi:hypothetical protein